MCVGSDEACYAGPTDLMHGTAAVNARIPRILLRVGNELVFRVAVTENEVHIDAVGAVGRTMQVRLGRVTTNERTPLTLKSLGRLFALHGGPRDVVADVFDEH